jgi:hypothetical protein
MEPSRRTLLELIKDENWARVYRRVAKSPEELQRMTLINLDGHSSEAYPLHYLCRKKEAPVAVVEAFVNAWPEAARTQDSILESLPLHVACEHDASVEVLAILIHAYPEGLTKPDKYGNLPIHCASSLESPESALLLLHACPESAKMKTNKGQTPLHLACSRYDISNELVQVLIQLYKDACKSRDWQGRLPLHSACMWNAPTCVLELLLQCYPEGVRLEDSYRMTPYSICRKVFHLDHHESTVKLLRSYHKKRGGLLSRSRDLVQFKAENLSDSLGMHSHHKLFHHVHAE